MAKHPTMNASADNGGRRRIRDRRFLVSVSRKQDRRTNWERRSGYDRRLRRTTDVANERRQMEAGSPGHLS